MVLQGQSKRDFGDEGDFLLSSNTRIQELKLKLH
jgi:hypothetical protein